MNLSGVPVVEQQLAAHLAAADYQSVPEAALSRARRSILWWIATALEGSMAPEQAALRQYFGDQGGPAESSVLGTRLRAPAEVAGLINGRAGKVNEREEKYWVSESIGFSIGVCVVPAAVAVAQAAGPVSGPVSGRDLLAAVAVATDLEARLLRPVGMGFIPGRKAANTSFALGNYGAAVVAGKLLALAPEQFLDALGLAHAQSCGTYQGQYDGRGVPVQCGFAVRNGIIAARLASAGVTGPIASITGRAGLYAQHFPHSAVEFDSLLDELAHDYLGAKIGFKAYPCGIVAHPAVDAAREVRPQFGARTIHQIKVSGSVSLRIMAEPAEQKQSPRTATEARFSIPWAVACAMRDDELTLRHFEAESLNDPGLRATAAKVHVAMDDAAEGTTLAVTFTDGSAVRSAPVIIARGHPDRPLATSDIEDLFRASAERARVPAAQARRALKMLANLESVSDVRDIVALLESDGPR
jgi:2-methylcitrate dehydratase PrpD